MANEKFTKEYLQGFWSGLMRDVYREFVYKQKDQQKWEAGMTVINQLPVK